MNDTLTQAVTGTSDTDADSTTNNNNKTTIPSLQTTPTSVKTNMSTSSTPPPYTAPLIVFDFNGILVHKVWNNKFDKTLTTRRKHHFVHDKLSIVRRPHIDEMFQLLS